MPTVCGLCTWRDNCSHKIQVKQIKVGNSNLAVAYNYDMNEATNGSSFSECWIQCKNII